MKTKLRAAIDKTRLKNGLAVYEKPLIKGKCQKCERAYYWRVLPETCPWPNCEGRIRESA